MRHWLKNKHQPVIDPAHGLPSGRRLHKPYVVTKPMDAASIGLRQALLTNETLTTVTLHFYRPAATASTGIGGEAKPYYTVVLENAHVVSDEAWEPLTTPCR